MTHEQAEAGLLYVCYYTLDDPLVETQVVTYLEGLAAAGLRVHLLTFEPRRLEPPEVRERAAALGGRGVAWHHLRYHKAPSLPATVFDTMVGAMTVRRLMRRHRLGVVHARSHVPAAMALMASWARQTRPQMVFDLRGLMAEEYEDAGRWERGGIPFRLTKWVERRALARADQVVVLTRRVARMLFGDPPRGPVTVIPCCTDLERVARDAAAGRRVRQALRLGEDPVLVYVGKLTGWYLAEEMAAFFAQARPVVDGLRWLVLTQDDPAPLAAALDRLGVPRAATTITSCTPAELGAHLSAADAAISFIEPAPSKASSSPTKVGEYLGAGLPIACTSGVGDLDEVLGDEVAVLVADHDPASHRAAAEALAALIADPATTRRCVALAAAEFDMATVGIPAYRRVYAALSSEAPMVAPHTKRT